MAVPSYPRPMARESADIVIVGAGIAGVSVAHHLTTRLGVRDVVICDPRPPLTLTSDKSTECYRNLWPNRPMVQLMNRSIDLMEEFAGESDNAFGMTRRGYLYLTEDPARLEQLHQNALASSQFGAGPVRVHRGGGDDPPYLPPSPEGWEDAPDGADLIADPGLLHRTFPGLGEEIVGGLHVRRAGWVSAQQMGSWMLDRARDAGARLVAEQVTGFDTAGGRVTGVRLGDGSTIATESVVNAAGPMVQEVAGLLGERLPLHSEVHLKVAFRDTARAVDRDAPMIIWADPQHLDWTDEERAYLEAEGRSDLLGELPVACHGRPEGRAGSSWVLALWEYHRKIQEPTWPLPDDPLYPEVVLRGLRRMVPGVAAYRDRLPESVVDGGYYTKTRENRPLAGPLDTPGAHLAGALSGFGVMVAAGLAELAALHAVGGALPAHAPAFTLQRYDDPAHLAEIAALADTGQL